MKAANSLRNNSPALLKGAEVTQSQALKYAWWFEDFRNKLHSGIFRFSYFKKDGSIREAYGTLNPDLIPGASSRQTGGAASAEEGINYDTFAYYDLSAAGWRSFRLDNFIGFVEQV